MKMNQNPELIYRNAVIEGCRYIKENSGIKSMVLGVSGGIDSAVTAALAMEVANKTGIKFIGRVLPLYGNGDDEVQRAKAICKAFCHEYEVVELTEVVDEMFKKAIGKIEPYGDLKERICRGNIKARTRMMYLYDLAQLNDGMVLSTDNYTELLLGFWTLHGDVGDFGFIQELWKTEVYALGEYLSKIYDGLGGAFMAECVNAKPTDGLGVTQSDIDQILPEWKPSDGSYRDAYRKVDEILIGYLYGEGMYNETHPVIARHLATAFKRKNPVNLKREMLVWPYNKE